MIKKKYLGTSKLLFLLLSILLLGLFSTTYANSDVFTEINTMSPFIMEQIIEKIDNASSLYQNSSTPISNFNSFKNNYDIEQVCSAFNNFFSDKSIDYFENCSMIITIYDSKFTLRVSQNNNSHHETYPFIQIWARSSTETDFNYVSSNGTTINDKPYYMVTFNTNGTLSFISTSAPYSRIGEVYGQSTTFVDSIINCPYFISFNSIQNSVCYYKNGNNAGFWGFVDNIVLLSEPQPEEPSGDSGGLGYITTPSGDNGGSINLQPIQQGLTDIQNQISGDTQKVIENQNQNTQTIVNAISGEVNIINNSLTDTTVDTDISGELSSMINSADIDDPTSNFFSWLLDQLQLVFTTTTEQTIEFDFLTKHIVISTNDFIIPDSDLKTFLSLSFTAWFGFSIIKKIHYIVYAVKCVKINDAMKQVEFNPNLL